MKWFRSQEREEECRTDPIPFSDEDEATIIFQDNIVIVIAINRSFYTVQRISKYEFMVYKLNALFPVDPKDEAQMKEFNQVYTKTSNWSLKFNDREEREAWKRIVPFLKMRDISL